PRPSSRRVRGTYWQPADGGQMAGPATTKKIDSTCCDTLDAGRSRSARRHKMAERQPVEQYGRWNKSRYCCLHALPERHHLLVLILPLPTTPAASRLASLPTHRVRRHVCNHQPPRCSRATAKSKRRPDTSWHQRPFLRLRLLAAARHASRVESSLF